MTIRNRFSAPKKQWAKWSPLARHVFNSTFEAARDTILWPNSLQHVTVRSRRVIAWNAAWTAADAVREYERAAR